MPPPPEATPTATLPPEIDCNRNGRVDRSEIDEGSACDCDANSRPDECDPDADRDSIPDACDRCPGMNDLLDRDNDLVPDCLDLCPTDPLKTEGGQCGCGAPEVDQDDDGIADCVDNCLDTPNPDQSDLDGDKLGDACDGCPENRYKSEPGVCGCADFDTDDDGDGTLDCFDGCPRDRHKTEPGICGCNVPESGAVDSDGDSVPDCLDTCPDADDLQDSDGDGFSDCKDRCPFDSAVPAHGVPLLYVADREQSVLRAINPYTKTVIDEFAITRTPRLLVFSPDGRYAMGIVKGGGHYDVVDLHRGELIDPFPSQPTLYHPRSATAAVSGHSGSSIYTGTQVGRSYRIDPRAGVAELLSPLSVRYPWTLHLTDDPPLLYAVQPPQYVVTDTATGDSEMFWDTTLQDAIPRPGTDEDFLSTKLPSFVVVDRYQGDVLRTMKETSVITARWGLQFSPDGKYLWALGPPAFAFGERITVFDPEALTPLGTARIVNPTLVYALDDSGRTAFLPFGGGKKGLLYRYTVGDDAEEFVMETGGEIATLALGPDLRGDANCDREFTAADIAAMLRVLSGGERSPCRFDDYDRSCSVEPGDFEPTVRRVFR